MPFDLHTVEVQDGTTPLSQSDKLIFGQFLAQPFTGGGTTTTVTATWPVPGALPANGQYFVDVEVPSAMIASVGSKTSAGFIVTLTALTGDLPASGTINVRVVC
jgi:hypothetical protein